MSKDKVRRARRLASKKMTAQQIETRKQFERERKDKENLFRERSEFHVKVLEAKQIWLIGQRKAKEIREDFKSKQDEFPTKEEYVTALNKLIVQQEQVLETVKQKYKAINKEYKNRYELGTYKFKRWFYGMGKEFERITWCNNRTLWKSFLIIIIVVVLLAILFGLLGLIQLAKPTS